MPGVTVDAYCVLAGGGVKALAFPGALEAARGAGIRFRGYAGSSGGAIVACLAAAGFEPIEIRDAFQAALNLDRLLGDTRLIGELQETLRHIREAVESSGARRLRRGWSAVRSSKSIRAAVLRDLGLYDPDLLRNQLWALLSPRFENADDITFGDIAEAGGQLRIVASDVRLHSPKLFGADPNGSVLDAVTASACYPLIFKPKRVEDADLVDGGVSSNVPIFAFVDDGHARRLPTVAFDLVTTPTAAAAADQANPRSLFPRYVSDLASTALSASDVLIEGIVDQGVVVPIEVPAGLTTFSSAVESAAVDAAWNAGHTAATTFFNSWQVTTLARLAGDNLTHQLQAVYGSPALVTSVLVGIQLWIEARTQARDTRLSIMVETPLGRRQIIYSLGMDGHADGNMDLDLEAGLTGETVREGRPLVADLEAARVTPGRWAMSESETSRVPADRKAMVSVPVRAWRPGETVRDFHEAAEKAIIAVLTVDTSTPLGETGWLQDNVPAHELVTGLLDWAELLAKVFE